MTTPIAIIGLLSLLAIVRSVAYGPSSGPNVIRSRGGYESHLDFLESHGFITAEERRRDREVIQEYKEHPERFTVYSWDDLKRKFVEKGSPDGK